MKKILNLILAISALSFQGYSEEALHLESILDSMISNIDSKEVSDCLKDLEDHQFQFSGTQHSLTKPIKRVQKEILSLGEDFSDNEKIDLASHITNRNQDKADFIAQLIKNYKGRLLK